MNQKLIIGIIVLIVIIGGGWLAFRGGAPGGVPAPAPSPAPAPAPTPTPQPASSPVTYTVSMTSAGFSPENLTIKVGDTVVFQNNDTRSRWPASAVHPTHQICPGFDALRMVPPTDSYSYTFTAAKECPHHDHLIPSLKGKITVSE